MNQKDATSASSGGASPARTDTSNTGAKPSIGETASQASKAAMDEAKSLGGDAKHLVEDQAENIKEMAASHMDVFADALRAASDRLGKAQTGPASEMVANAASGLEGLSRSLHGKSTGEMVDTIRQFGRTNPIGFLAGSVLAGVALGRFAAAGAPSSTGKSQPSNASQAGSTHNDRGIAP